MIDCGAARLVGLTHGRKRALVALAYQIGGLLARSGLPQHEVTARLTAAGHQQRLHPTDAHRIVTRALANGQAQPLTPPPAWSPGIPLSRDCHTQPAAVDLPPDRNSTAG